jgi:hypothetical protein
VVTHYFANFYRECIAKFLSLRDETSLRRAQDRKDRHCQPQRFVFSLEDASLNVEALVLTISTSKRRETMSCIGTGIQDE